jgi:hypothetical protein
VRESLRKFGKLIERGNDDGNPHGWNPGARAGN